MCDCTDHKDEIPAYDAQAIESRWMKAWEDSNLFAVDTDDVVAGAPFVIRGVRGLSFGSGGVGLFRCAASECSMRPFCVVVPSEFVELLLQLGDCFCWWSCFDPAFERLVESFDLALSLWVPRSAIFLLNAVVIKGFLEGVATSFPAGESCCKNQSVVGKRGCWRPIGVDEVLELFCHCSARKRVLGGN